MDVAPTSGAGIQVTPPAHGSQKGLVRTGQHHFCAALAEAGDVQRDAHDAGRDRAAALPQRHHRTGKLNVFRLDAGAALAPFGSSSIPSAAAVLLCSS